MSENAQSPLNEFSLIRQYFTRPTRSAVLGVGDDCALLSNPQGEELAISTDMLVSGRHFFPDVDPAALGHKALAVNLSDLAAMGATPRAFTLALALPEADPAWLAAFSKSLFALAQTHECELIGGDTTRGPLNICITVLGGVPTGQALRRDGAKIGDEIWVSGQLGDARLALGHIAGEWQLDSAQISATRPALETPTPRVALGIALREIASSALDISDGLIGDLQHILERSHVGARLDISTLPRSTTLMQQPLERQLRCALTGGDDYELCFTAAPQHSALLALLAKTLQLPLTRIGSIHAGTGLRLVDATGNPAALPESLQLTGFDHFAE